MTACMSMTVCTHTHTHAHAHVHTDDTHYKLWHVRLACMQGGKGWGKPSSRSRLSGPKEALQVRMEGRGGEGGMHSRGHRSTGSRASACALAPHVPACVYPCVSSCTRASCTCLCVSSCILMHSRLIYLPVCILQCPSAFSSFATFLILQCPLSPPLSPFVSCCILL